MRHKIPHKAKDMLVAAAVSSIWFGYWFFICYKIGAVK